MKNYKIFVAVTLLIKLFYYYLFFISKSIISLVFRVFFHIEYVLNMFYLRIKQYYLNMIEYFSDRTFLFLIPIKNSIANMNIDWIKPEDEYIKNFYVDESREYRFHHIFFVLPMLFAIVTGLFFSFVSKVYFYFLSLISFFYLKTHIYIFYLIHYGICYFVENFFAFIDGFLMWWSGISILLKWVAGAWVYVMYVEINLIAFLKPLVVMFSSHVLHRFYYFIDIFTCVSEPLYVINKEKYFNLLRLNVYLGWNYFVSHYNAIVDTIVGISKYYFPGFHAAKGFEAKASLVFGFLYAFCRFIPLIFFTVIYVVFDFFNKHIGFGDICSFFFSFRLVIWFFFKIPDIILSIIDLFLSIIFLFFFKILIIFPFIQDIPRWILVFFKILWIIILSIFGK